MNATKQAIIAALYKFARQRAGLDFANYGDVKAYRAESRSITRDLDHARTLIRAVELRDSITAEHIIEASKRAFSGRLTITVEGERVRIDYCTGQYFPTEYRRAVCAVMASCLWDYWRDAMPEPVGKVHKDYGHGTTIDVDLYRMPGGRGRGSAGDYLRACGTREFGRAIGARWFN